ncbi:MAG: hypothetical protein QOJ29_665 [Thermoleophilaceae bacterium]|nr:hypothetical protein [Thermoleophilaceae bacterium]
MLDVLGAAKEEDWYPNIVWIDRRKCLLITTPPRVTPLDQPEAAALHGELFGCGRRVSGGGQRPVSRWVGAVCSTIAWTIVSQSARSTP